jgi:PAS domain S-box-containing protein
LPAAAAATKNVLILSSFEEESRPAQNVVITAILEIFDTASEPIETFSESLDSARFPAQSNETRMRAFLQDKYADVPIDLVIAAGPEALAFLTRHGAALFPRARWVFSGIREATFVREALPPNATGVFSHFDLTETLDLALALQPDATRVAVVAGAARLDTTWIAFARERLRSYEDRLEVTYLAGEPLSRLAEQLGRLPRNAIVICLSIIRNGDGQNFKVRTHAPALFAASSAPVYSPYEVLLGHGIVGGYMDRFAAIGAQTGRLALHVLGSDSAEALPPQRSERPVFVVDWQQLRRWGLDESSLPPGTVVEFREPSVWDQYRAQILLVIVVVVLQAAAIMSLVLLQVRKRRAERALQESEERYRDVVETQTDLICRYSPDSTLTFVNDAYCRYFEKSRDELVGKKFVDLIPEHERAGALAHVQSLLARPRSEGFEHGILKADGSIGWQHWVDHVILSANGIVEIQGVGRDVTQLKLAENEALERREQVTHLTRVGILGELSGALAHELNQPLTAILMNVESAQRLLGMEQIDLAEIRSILADVANDDRRASEVIARLRVLLKRGVLKVESLDANGLVTEVLALMRGQLIERRVSVFTKLAAALPTTRGDRVQLQQVLLNCLVNACDSVSANGEDDRSLTISTEAGDDAYVRVSIADNGCGIPAEANERIFEPFFTTKQAGLGLGLSICRSIIVAHGGQLAGTNNPDRGATFTLTLPARSASFRDRL